MQLIAVRYEDLSGQVMFYADVDEFIMVSLINRDNLRPRQSICASVRSIS